MTGQTRADRAGTDRPDPCEHGDLTPEWRVEVRRDGGAVESLRAEWESLYGRCAAATPFQSWGWVASWWRSYGVPGALRLVVVWRSGELVAVVPLMVRRRYGHRVLVPLGEGISDHVDVLADLRWAPQALRLAVAALLGERGWAAIDLPELAPGALAWRLAEAWPGPAHRLPSSVCMQMDFRSTSEYLAGLPKSRRKKMRRSWNKADSLGLSVRDVPADQVQLAIARLVRLHERQWQGRGVSPEHLRPRFARHLTEALSVMVPAGQAIVTEYALDERVVAVYVGVVGHDLVGGYLYGIDPRARSEIDFTPLFLTTNLSFAESHGLRVVSLLRGAEPHKEYWHLRPVANGRLVLTVRRRLMGASYTTVVRGRTALAALVKTRLPRLRPLLDRLRRRAPAGGPSTVTEGETSTP